MQTIQIPSVIKSKLTLKFRFIFWGLCLASILFSYLLKLIIDDEPTIMIWAMVALFSIMAITSLYTIFVVDILRICFIDLKEKGISIKTPFNTKRMQWDDIVSVSHFEENGNIMLGFVLMSDLNDSEIKKIKDSGTLDNSNKWSYKFSMNLFACADSEILFNLILSRIQQSELNSNK